MSDGYRRQRVVYQDVSGALLVTALTPQTTLATVRKTNTIYVQHVHIQVTTVQAGTSWTLQDSSGIVLVASQPVTAVGGFDFDFGANGVPLTAGTSLVFVPSGLGAAGSVEWDAYMRLAPGTAVSIANS